MKYCLNCVGIVVFALAGCREGTQGTQNRDSDGGDVMETDVAKGIVSLMNWIPVEPGAFMMGSPESESGRNENEYQHEVTHLHRYEIAATEVTCEQWLALETGIVSFCDPELLQAFQEENLPVPCGDDDCPVTGVNLDSVRPWLDALSVSAGLTPCYAEGASWPTPMHCPGYRLPTESEWERAARAGDDRATYNGDFVVSYQRIEVPSALVPIAWCGGPGIPYGDEKARAVAIGLPNALGLYDMIGNAEELTVWEGIYSNTPVSNPYAAGDPDLVAMRGGFHHSYYEYYRACRAASRLILDKDNGAGGFRPVRTLPDSLLPEPAPVDLCPLPVPEENCAVATGEMPLLFHPAKDGVRFVDMTPTDSWKISLLGEDAALGPFVENYHFSDGTVSTHFPVNPLTAGSGVALAAIEQSGTSGIVAALCESDTCALYALSSEYDPAAMLVPMANGEIPPWLGQNFDLLYLVDPFRIIVAGNGIASFDGTVWQEEVPPDTGALLLSIHSYMATQLIASGRNGRLLLYDGDGWRELNTQVNSDLLDASLYIDRDRNLNVMAVGTAGTVLDGLVDDDLVICKVGDVNISQVIRDAYGSEYNLFFENGVRIFQSEQRLGLGNCRMNPAAEQTIVAVLFDCGISHNAFFLTETGLFGEEFGCAID